ncbi:MAG: hypothetical protein ACRDE2_06105 [Chitinophagaceae bacterium]
MRRTGFIRCANEENTVIASLLSVENIFTHFVIIYSDITDSSLKLIEEYSRGRRDIIIEKYPYSVFPPHSHIYKQGIYDYKHSLAAYYNWGMKLCEKIGGSICKIDCDQVYIEDVVAEQFKQHEKRFLNDESNFYRVGLWGINSFVYKKRLLIPSKIPLNGLHDHYITSCNMKIFYIQSGLNEVSVMPEKTITLPSANQPAWFHFRKNMRGINESVSDAYSIDEFIADNGSTMILDEELASLFENKIRPILVKGNSPHQNCKLS